VRQGTQSWGLAAHSWLSRESQHGTSGLWAIDASIVPAVTSGNTNAPAIMIAEPGADMVKRETERG
jgi:choline dehydrogenase